MSQLGRQFSLFETDIRYLEFRKPSALTQMSNKGNLNQRKSMNAFLVIAKDILKRYPNCELFQADLGVLKAMAGIHSNYNKKLKKDLKALTTMGFEYNILKKEEHDRGAFPFLSFINIKSKRGQTAKVIFSLAPPIKAALTDPNMWVKLCIFFQHKMKSKYGIALWENLSDYAKLEKITYGIDQFKQLMGIESHQYKVITMLKQKVIDVGLKEVNEQTNLSATYKFLKEGNKITRVTFYPKITKVAISQQEVSKNIHSKLKFYGFKDIEIKKRLEKHDEDYLLSNIAVVEGYLEKGMEIKNIKAYIKSAFKADYRPSETEYDKQETKITAAKIAKETEEQKEKSIQEERQQQFKEWKNNLALERFATLSEEGREEYKTAFLEKAKDNHFLAKNLQKMGFEHPVIQ